MTEARRIAQRPGRTGEPAPPEAARQGAQLPLSEPRQLLAAAGLEADGPPQPVLFSTHEKDAAGAERAIVLTPSHLLVASLQPGSAPRMVAYDDPARLHVEPVLVIRGRQTIEVTGLHGWQIAELEAALASAAPRTARALAVRLLEHVGLAPGSPGCSLTPSGDGSVLDALGLQIRFDENEQPIGLLTQEGGPQ